MKHFLFGAYAFTIAYGALFYYMGEAMVLLTVVMMMGLPLLLYAFLAYVATPAIACVMGYYARWSVPVAVFLGYPLVLLASFVFPLATEKGKELIPVPWLALYKTSARQDVLAEMPQWIAWWSAAFAVCFVAGLLSRRVSSPAETAP